MLNITCFSPWVAQDQLMTKRICLYSKVRYEDKRAIWSQRKKKIWQKENVHNLVMNKNVGSRAGKSPLPLGCNVCVPGSNIPLCSLLRTGESAPSVPVCITRLCVPLQCSPSLPECCFLTWAVLFASPLLPQIISSSTWFSQCPARLAKKKSYSEISLSICIPSCSNLGMHWINKPIPLLLQLLFSALNFWCNLNPRSSACNPDLLHFWCYKGHWDSGWWKRANVALGEERPGLLALFSSCWPHQRLVYSHLTPFQNVQLDFEKGCLPPFSMEPKRYLCATCHI